MTTDGLSQVDRGEAWRDIVCKMIHNVDVDSISPGNFEARISARRHADVSCAYFRSKAHRVLGAAERFSNAGGSGYLLSWQLEGHARVVQDDTEVLLKPGGVAIVDGRRSMQVTFPDDVCRIVAKLPARAVERRLPGLLRSHALAFVPTGPLASVLFSYLRELSDENSSVQGAEMDLLVENICNLLEITATRAGLSHCNSKELRRQALVRYLRREAWRPNLSLDDVAGHLNVSPRLAQKILHDIGTSFTEFVLEERLQNAAQELLQTPDSRISDVAYRSGFNDISHFNRLFRRRFGTTPSDYCRQRH